MRDTIAEVKVGSEVPDFELKVYLPDQKNFGTIDLAGLKAEGKWTILFFYPADFTFV